MSEIEIEEESVSQTAYANADVLDTTEWTPSPRQLISCKVCDQKFTNKVKLSKYFVLDENEIFLFYS